MSDTRGDGDACIHGDGPASGDSDFFDRAVAKGWSDDWLTTTDAPSAARCMALVATMPWEASVTMAVLPAGFCEVLMGFVGLVGDWFRGEEWFQSGHNGLLARWRIDPMRIDRPGCRLLRMPGLVRENREFRSNSSRENPSIDLEAGSELRVIDDPEFPRLQAHAWKAIAAANPQAYPNPQQKSCRTSRIVWWRSASSVLRAVARSIWVPWSVRWNECY